LEAGEVTRKFPEKKRGQIKRTRKSIVFIITEGAKTEVAYFKNFNTRESRVEIKVVPSQHKSALALVKHAQDAIQHQNYSPKDGDQLWCVFDCDSNTDANLQGAEQIAQQNGYHLAFSNPAFELWFLLHFTDHRSYTGNADELIGLLRRENRLPHYDKAKDFYTTLQPKTAQAIARAHSLQKAHQGQGLSLFCREANPCTTVAQLVEMLIRRAGQK
jgi:hypothetical protein